MRTVCGKGVHAAGGNPGSEICKGNFRRRGGGADFRVLGIDDMAAVAVRALVPCQEAMVNNLIVSGQGDSESLTVVAVQNIQKTFPGDIFKIVFHNKLPAAEHQLLRRIVHNLHSGDAQPDLFGTGPETHGVIKKFLDPVLGENGQIELLSQISCKGTLSGGRDAGD